MIDGKTLFGAGITMISADPCKNENGLGAERRDCREDRAEFRRNVNDARKD